MKLTFFLVDNHMHYDRHTFDNKTADEIKSMLNSLYDTEVRVYNMDDEYDRICLQEDYNDELLDGGWWMITLND